MWLDLLGVCIRFIPWNTAQTLIPIRNAARTMCFNSATTKDDKQGKIVESAAHWHELSKICGNTNLQNYASRGSRTLRTLNLIARHKLWRAINIKHVRSHDVGRATTLVQNGDGAKMCASGDSARDSGRSHRDWFLFQLMRSYVAFVTGHSRFVVENDMNLLSKSE
jgi:hypothetical protein